MLACVFGLAACGSDDEALEPLEPLALRDGAALVHDFGATRAYEEVVVQDLARRGSRVVMLVVRDRIAMVDPFTGPVHAYTPAYFVSDDVGLSWREVDIRPLTNGDRWLRAEAIYPVSLVFDGDDLYELVYDWEDTEGLANFLNLTHIYRLDLDAGTRRLVARCAWTSGSSRTTATC